MSNIISEVIKIKYNSFTMAPVLLSYYESCKVKRDNVLLVYLLFPVILSSDWMQSSPRVQIRSRLEAWVRDNRLHIEGLPERLQTFQHLSETTLQYCIDMQYAIVDENNNVVVVNNPFKAKGRKSHFEDSATRFAKLLGSNSPTTIYSTLGIKELTI